MSCEYWKRRYDVLVDVLKEEYGSAVIDLLGEVTERIDREESRKHRAEKIDFKWDEDSDEWDEEVEYPPFCFGDYACGCEECDFCEWQEECMEMSYPPGTFEEEA